MEDLKNKLNQEQMTSMALVLSIQMGGIKDEDIPQADKDLLVKHYGVNWRKDLKIDGDENEG